MKTIKVHFVRYAESLAMQIVKHIRYVEVELLATKGVSIAHYLCVGDHKRSKTEKVISSQYVLIYYANNTSHRRQTSIS